MLLTSWPIFNLERLDAHVVHINNGLIMPIICKKSKHMDLRKLKTIYVVPSAYMCSGSICLSVQITWLQLRAMILHM